MCFSCQSFSINKIMIQQRQISLVKTLVPKTFPGGLWNLNPNFSFACDQGEAQGHPTSQSGVSLVMNKMIMTSCPLEDQEFL